MVGGSSLVFSDDESDEFEMMVFPLFSSEEGVTKHFRIV